MFTSCTSTEKTQFKQIVIRDEVLALVHHSCKKVAVYVHHRVLWPNIFLIFIVWINWKTLQPTTFLVGDWSRVLGSAQSLQKRSLFATKLFRRLQKAIVKTSFFDDKSLPSTMTRQISTHLWWQNESVENTYYFCRKCDFFWREMFLPYLLRRHKNVCR